MCFQVSNEYYLLTAQKTKRKTQLILHTELGNEACSLSKNLHGHLTATPSTAQASRLHTYP
jgi:hypothetical protein